MDYIVKKITLSKDVSVKEDLLISFWPYFEGDD